MAEEQLIVRMDGPPEDGGAVLGGHFMNVLNSALALLKQAEKELATSKDGRPRFEFFVVSASRASPCMVEIACRPAKDGAHGKNPVHVVGDAFRSIKSGKVEEVSAAMMAKVGKLIAPRGAKARHRLSHLALRFVGGRKRAPQALIDSAFMGKMDQSRGREHVCLTQVAGVAKALDLRKKGEIRLKTFSRIEGNVTCVMDPKLLERARAAMGEFVIMNGVGRYRPGEFHPHQIRVEKEEDIRIVLKDPNAPKLTDLRGAFPGLTGGKPVLEYLREIRGEGG